MARPCDVGHAAHPQAPTSPAGHSGPPIRTSGALLMHLAFPRRSAGLALLALLAALLLTVPAGATAATPKPTVVLVHGAWADASGWSGVAQRLQAKGYTVIAPANPLRGVPADSAYIKTVLASIKGPIV